MTITFHKATAADSDLVADLVFGEANGEGRRVAAAVFGISDSERLRPLFRRVWRAAENWRQCELLFVEGKPAGVLQTGSSSMKITPGVVFAAIRALGPLALRMPGRLGIMNRVAPKKPNGAFIISEIHVDEEYRGRGLGARMMALAEEQARAGGYRLMALHTRTNNPARSFYERLGFTVAAEAHDAGFEHLTGVKGNVLYLKQLD